MTKANIPYHTNFRHLTPMQYDLEMTRCIQTSVVRQQQQQQQQQHDQLLQDEHQEHQMQQISQQHSLSLNTENGGDVQQHTYMNTNADGSSHFSSGPSHDDSQAWGSSQSTNDNYISFVGSHDSPVKRGRFEQGTLLHFKCKQLKQISI